MTVLIIDNYDSFTFNLFQLLQEQTNDQVVVHRNDALTFDEIKAMAPKAIVLSPGPGHPSLAKDFGVCAEVVNRAAELGCPVLGVCLGHQGIGHYLGGKVERAPQIIHGKTSKIEVIAESPLFSGMPKNFQAMRYHSLVVSEDSLPECLTVTARDEATSLIMALQHKRLPLYGVQFHPESIGTPLGKTILTNFLNLC